MAENNSPFGFTKDKLPTVGETYYIDERANHKEGVVKVVHVHGKLFCRVTSADGTGDSWETMCSRLTEIPQEEIDQFKKEGKHGY
jgi:hypothetical protein